MNLAATEDEGFRIYTQGEMPNCGKAIGQSDLILRIHIMVRRQNLATEAAPW